MSAFEKEHGAESLHQRLGLPANPYFSASKLHWILDNVPGARQKAVAGDLLFGTIDSWLIWKLSGWLHITDVTNASRTFLLNIKTLTWDEEMLRAFDIPSQVLPEIRSSSEIYGEISHPVLKGVPLAGNLGDQHAALFGQCCFEPEKQKHLRNGLFYVDEYRTKADIQSKWLAYDYGISTQRPAGGLRA